MNISQLKNSRFLSKDDVEPQKEATISHVDEQNVAPADQKPEKRWVLNFKEPDIKPLVLNVTNGEAIAEITGTGESDGWTGTKIVLYHDPNVSFSGKRVGGVRIRRATTQASAPTVEDVSW